MGRKGVKLGLVAAAVLAAGCGSEGGGDGGVCGAEDGVLETAYVVGSIVFGERDQAGYVAPRETLAGCGDEKLKHAYEFAGLADVWVEDGAVFVASGEAPTITRYALTDAGELAPQGTVSFGSYGVISAAFWNNKFASAEKAYMANGPTQFVVWNPTTMTITGTVDLPELEAREGLEARVGLADRADVVSGGRLYQPMYWSDDSYAERADDSRIAVLDVATDELVDVIEAPCPGLDMGTVDEDGYLYFSNWTGGAGTHLVLGTAATCVVKVDPATLTATRLFHFADVTGGREGAAFHALGGGRFAFSTFHHERVDIEGATDPFTIIAGEDWALWVYDAATGQAEPAPGAQWNSGAVVWYEIGGRPYALLPGADYATTSVYDLGGETATRLFGVSGWAIRLFQVR